jgi:2',3'-cyclic-nucleotide 2'-phosphodiesterase (5'-nucleotidase family)
MKYSGKSSWRYIAVAASLFLTLSCRTHFEPVASQASLFQIDSSITPDKRVEAYIAPYTRQLQDSMNTVIGYAATGINKASVESALGNFVADLTQEQASARSNKPVDMGAVTIGGLRINLSQGPVKVGDIFELMPFENEIVVLELKPETVKEMFDFLAARKILAVSNSKVIIEDQKVKEIYIGGKPFDPNRTYTLAISDYLAGGGDDMHFLKQAVDTRSTDVKVRDAIINTIQSLAAQGDSVRAGVGGRVIIKN